MSAFPDSNLSGIAMLFASVIPLLLGLVLNIICGIVAMNMAKSRGLNHVPAFFAGFFGSFVALFFIAMFPKQNF